MSFDEIWNRIKEGTDLRTFVELAPVVGVQQSAISKAKSKDDFPARWIFAVAQKYDLNSDWIRSGQGPMHRHKGLAERISKEGVEAVREPWEEMTAFKTERWVDEKMRAGEPAGEYNRRAADVGLGKSVELLAQIYNSGNQVLIRAIVANLLAFSEAVENKARAIDAERRLKEVEGRLEKLEKRLTKSQDSGEEAAGGNGQQ